MSGLAARGAPPDSQRVWIVFSGGADHRWPRLLRPGFRHCFAVLHDVSGWTVLDPFTGRLACARPEVMPDFDLPRFFRRAGMRVLGPFAPAAPGHGRSLLLAPFSCVSVCRAVLGPAARRAWNPHDLYRRLRNLGVSRKKNLTLARMPR